MHSETGQATTEYALLLIVVSVVIIGAMLAGSQSLLDLYQDAEDVVQAAIESVTA
jgi:Flp pilus assembly pilin Flp